MDCLWKTNWDKTKKNFIDWWNHEGFIIDLPFIRNPTPTAKVQNPGPPHDVYFQHTDPDWIARNQKYHLSHQLYLGDTLPIAMVDIGYQTLSLYLGGADPIFKEDTIWYEPLMKDWDKVGDLSFDPANRWYQNHLRIYEKSVAMGRDLYFTGTPGLGCNIDILSAIRGSATLMIDLIERPQWVKEKLEAINQAYFLAFQGLYDIYKLEDGSSCASYYDLWAPGKVALVMAEVAVMISPAMFQEFVVPPLKDQCRWLDHSAYLIDGKECLRFIDELLGIDELDAIAFDPGPKGQPGDDPVWYDLYKRILKAGKSVQIFGSDPAKAIPLLDKVGSAGVYLTYYCLGQNQAEILLKHLAPYVLDIS